MIKALNETECIGGIVAWKHLIGGHPAENRICPPGTLSRFLQILLHFMTRTDSGNGIMLRKDTPLAHGRKEINEGYQRKQRDRHHIGKEFLELAHNWMFINY